MNHDSPSPSLATLLQQLRDESTTLFRQEIALAKAEMGEKASQLTRRSMQLATGGFVAYAGAIVLLLGLGDLLAFGLHRAGLAPDIALWLGRIVVGLVIAIIGYAMLAKAKHAMSSQTLVPEKTIQSLREDKDWARAKLHPSHEPTT